MNAARATLGVLGVLLLLSGCGQKGPLYLPDHRPRPVQPPGAPPNSSAPADATTAPPPAPTKRSDTDDGSTPQ
jgi:predicted small lipoprotein YifL